MSETPSGRVAASRLVPAAVGLGVLAVAQPLLDLLGRQPQFLVAHDLSPTEVTILAVMVVVMPAALFGLSAMLASGRWMAGLLVAIPVFLIFAHAGSRMEVDGPLMLILAAGLTTLTVATYFRYPPVQEVARYLVAVPAAVLVYFFVVLPAPVLAGDTPTGGGEVAREPVPVVVIVLDEFPLASLIDGEGRLLKEQYPSFGRLAEDGVWYRNAITVETRTTESIPAILSGLEVGDGLVPTASQHPRTLFTLLADSHDVGGMEPVTSLCPDQLCGDGADGRWIGTWARVASDVAVVYGHLVVPSPWVDRLPPIDQNWTGFGTSAEADADARSEWDLEEAVGGAVGAGRRAAVGRGAEVAFHAADV
ncbi:MAG: hypothetical protein ACLFWM_07795, partial [Actinomycetota bacterium]